MISKEVLKKIKLVVFDLDGTLLSDEGEVGEKTINLVKELRKLDVRFTFATGRLHSAVTKFAKQLEIKTPLITLDGSLIKSYPNSEIIYESFVKEKYVKKAIRLADSFLLKIALCHSDAIYFTEHNSTIPQIMDKLGAKYEEVESYDDYLSNTLEVVFASDHNENVKYVRKKMLFPYVFGLDTSFFKSHSHRGIYYLEVRNQRNSKGEGLKKLLNYLRLNIRETAVIGDWYNDRTLFETNALKIAVANAVPEIIRNSDFVTNRTNNEDATAEFLEMVLSSKKY